MGIFQAFLLGIVQGVAEFLPISSSGHLVLFQTLFGIKEPTFFFDVMLHVATLVPIFVVFWDDIFKLIKNPFQKTTYLLILATIPTVVFVVLFGDATDNLFASGKYLPFCFILTGLFLLYADKKSTGTKKEISYKDSLIIGLMQCLGTFPGVSRSGSTLTGALASDIDRDEAAKFCFLLAIPAILGALVLQIVDIIKGDVIIQNEHVMPIVVGCLSAMISGYIAIRFLLAIIKKAKLEYFAYYVFFIAFFILVCQYGFGMEFIIG